MIKIKNKYSTAVVFLLVVAFLNSFVMYAKNNLFFYIVFSFSILVGYLFRKSLPIPIFIIFFESIGIFANGYFQIISLLICILLTMTRFKININLKMWSCFFFFVFLKKIYFLFFY